MTSAQILNILGCFEVVLCAAGLWALFSRRQWRDYWALGSFLAVRALSSTVQGVLIYCAGGRIMNPNVAYHAYFYVYWFSFALESILSLIVIYSIFRLAMAPLRGLQGLGMLIFRWAAAISVAVALGSAFAPHQTGTKYLVTAISQLQRTQSILTLCLLLFVCFAIRPMGLSFRSRIFGVSLGLGMMSTTDLVQSAWLAHKHQMYQTYDFINAGAICLTLMIWTAYFAVPEPKRRIIVLPTTSPFLRWNQISLALGDDPGFVAVGGIHPDLFAPAELEVMRRASLKMVTPFPKPVARARPEATETPVRQARIQSAT